MENKRNQSYDYAKGIAIFFVVLYHIYGYTGRSGGSVVYTFCHVCQLQIFFYVSGILSQKSLSTGHFIMKDRCVRLLLPLFTFYLIWSIIDCHNFLEFPLSEFKQGYWFVLVLFIMIIIYLATCKLFGDQKSLIPLFVLYVLLTVYEVLYPKENLINRLLSLNLLWHYYPFFVMGTCHDRIKLLFELKNSIFYATVFGAAFYAYYTTGKKSLVPICNLSSLMFLMGMFQNRIWIARDTFMLFGKFSMEIYMLHFLFLAVLTPLIPLIDNRWIELPYYVIIALAMIILSIGCSIIMKKSKWLALFLFGIRMNKKYHNFPKVPQCPGQLFK